MARATLDEWIIRKDIAFSLGSPSSLNAALDSIMASLDPSLRLLGLGEALHCGGQILRLATGFFHDSWKGTLFRHPPGEQLSASARRERVCCRSQPEIALLRSEKSIALPPAAAVLHIEVENLIAELQVCRPEFVAKSEKDRYLETRSICRSGAAAGELSCLTQGIEEDYRTKEDNEHVFYHSSDFGKTRKGLRDLYHLRIDQIP